MQKRAQASDSSANPAPELIIPVAEIVAVHGLHGWVKLQVDAEYDVLKACPEWHFRSRGGQWQILKPEQVRHFYGRSLIKLAGSDNRDQARELIGAQIGIERAKLPKLEKDDYYWCDLVGLEVIGTEDVSLGKVSGLLSTPANDVMEVKGPQGKVLIPFTPGYVTRVDLIQGKIHTIWQLDY